MKIQQRAPSMSDPPFNLSFLSGEKTLHYADKIFRWIQYQLSIEDLFYPSTWLLPLRKEFQTADVIHLYVTHGGFFAFSVLPLISRMKPVVWRFSDQWAFTGHCPYSGDCQRWKSGCGQCPVFRQYPYAMKRDTTAWHWHLKKYIYSRSNILFVTPSSWMYELARESPLINSEKLIHIPNGVDTSLFQPIKDNVARQLLQIPSNAFVIMISTTIFGDKRKGKEIIEPILHRLSKINADRKIYFLLVGRYHEGGKRIVGKYFPFQETGYIEDQRMMAMVFSGSDILLHPAIDENLANTAMESMACGTPVVCFDVGGMSDVVENNKTGFISKPYDIDELVLNMNRIVESVELRRKMKSHCREKICEAFSAEIEARRYVEAYRKLILPYDGS